MKLNLKRTFIAAAYVAFVCALAFFGLAPWGAALGMLVVTWVIAEYASSMLFGRPALMLGALTPQFLFDFESNMMQITENEYLRMARDLWVFDIAKKLPSQKKRERIAWLLATAQIRSQGLGGNIDFDDLVAASVEYVNLNAGAGLKLTKDQLTDNDGDGLPLAQKWSGDIGSYMSYWPQKQVAKAILAGGLSTSIGYDGVSFFNTAHPVNPVDASISATFANDFTGAASGNYPGALPIDDATHGGYDGTVNSALINLSKAIAYVRGKIKMPNGEDPRYLKPVRILAPPRMTARIQQLTNARTIAQLASSSTAGSGDVEQMIKNWGLAKPIEVLEFDAGQSYTDEVSGSTITGSDTTWYMAVEEMNASQLGPIVYVEREPFAITYYTGSGGGTGVDAILDRAREFEWHCQGRNVTAYGHPYMLFRFQAT